ncbi:conjugal transfer protein TraO [Spirosoma sp. BT702]|uniref:Conjugal transfer protein TraO n=1 Tax=Spirosoma profusum TaxID=2771354 RepID=A0A926Y3G8_9BACT|nr:conjugal transfer protein TraO [Spirosoma profusum]MBD2703383.1 conjugal transfer protein TraO [Spirosoma profusum]
MRTRLIGLCLASLLYSLPTASAQIHQGGQSAVELSAGTLDGFRLPGKDNFGYFVSVSYSRYRSRYIYWKGGLHLNQKFYTYDQRLIPVSQWLGEATYFARVIGMVGRSWVLNIGGGIAGGYESINQDQQLVEGATLLNPSKWLLGPTIALEGEYILSGRTILIARIQEYYLFRSSIIPTRFNLGLGIKFILPSDSNQE